MKRLFFVLAITTIVGTSANAQSKPAISIGVDAGIPTTSGYSFVIGGSLQGDFKVADELALTLSAGYKSWQIKKDFGGGSAGLIPVLGGVKYYFTPIVYGSGQLGISFSTESGGGSAFTYAPGVGFKVSKNFDILAKYTGMSSNGINTDEVGVRAAYAF
jgi:hypothetical protein